MHEFYSCDNDSHIHACEHTPSDYAFISISPESSLLCVFVCVSGTSIVFDMSLTYILVALLAVILNNVLVERLSMHTRITVGESGEETTQRSLIVKKNPIMVTSTVTHLLRTLWGPQGLSEQNTQSKNRKPA